MLFPAVDGARHCSTRSTGVSLPCGSLRRLRGWFASLVRGPVVRSPWSKTATHGMGKCFFFCFNHWYIEVHNPTTDYGPRTTHDQDCHPRRLRLHGAGTDQDPASPSRARRSSPSLRGKRGTLRSPSCTPASPAGSTCAWNRSTPTGSPRAACSASSAACRTARACAAVAPLLERGIRVIDLSADYRLRDPNVYAQWYGESHHDLANLAQAVYGLPEMYGEPIGTARLVANPGCYPQTGILGLAPLVAEAHRPARSSSSTARAASPGRAARRS